MKKNNWPSYYDYWDKRKSYKIGEIKFIKNTRSHPHRKVFIDWIDESKDIKSVLEVGPGEMIEYQSISKKRPDIRYSIADIALLFINNCKVKYPNVRTYQIPLEQLDSLKNKFDCVYLASVLEHSINVQRAIKNCINVAKTFHFVFFKWKWSGGGLTSKFYKTKNLYSSFFNIWQIIEEIEKYGIIEFSSICTSKTGKLIPLEEYSKRKRGNNRDGNYLIIHGRKK